MSDRQDVSEASGNSMRVTADELKTAVLTSTCDLLVARIAAGTVAVVVPQAFRESARAYLPPPRPPQAERTYLFFPGWTDFYAIALLGLVSPLGLLIGLAYAVFSKAKRRRGVVLAAWSAFTALACLGGEYLSGGFNNK
jgi:hypothetical protein